MTLFQSQEKSAITKLCFGVIRQAVHDARAAQCIDHIRSEKRRRRITREGSDAIDFLRQYEPEFIQKVVGSSQRWRDLTDGNHVREWVRVGKNVYRRSITP